MSNIPIWNLREEFHLVGQLLSSENFPEVLRHHERPIRTPLFDWHGSDNDLLSLLVQRAIQGVESYTRGAVWIKLCELGRMTEDLYAKTRNPFSIQARSGTAAAYFHHLPALIDPDLSVKVIDPEYWEKLAAFYKDVRNPLFHGSHFASGDVQNATEAFWHIEELYAWLDQWYESGWTPGKRLFLTIRLSS
jgi:hypothetical protein